MPIRATTSRRKWRSRPACPCIHDDVLHLVHACLGCLRCLGCLTWMHVDLLVSAFVVLLLCRFTGSLSSTAS
jgi:hypothetical protein